MYKNQLQELAQRSCFNLPSYTCIREGPDHAPRFKATVNFNGEVFESPSYCTTLRQAEHAAAEVALNSLSHRVPSLSLAARIMDETGVYKNLLQEISQRVGAPLPQYTTFRSGHGYHPVFTGRVELADIIFTGEPAKNKKQAEKNAAMAAWSSLKQLAREAANSSSETVNNDELEQIAISRALLNYRLKEKMAMSKNPNAPLLFPMKFRMQNPRPSSPQCPPSASSKILPLICSKSTPRHRPTSIATFGSSVDPHQTASPEIHGPFPQKFPEAGAFSFLPSQHFSLPYHRAAPPVTIRTTVPVFSAPPQLPQPQQSLPSIVHPPLIRNLTGRHAPAVSVRQAELVFAVPPIQKDPPAVTAPAPSNEYPQAMINRTGNLGMTTIQESETKVQYVSPVSVKQAELVYATPIIQLDQPAVAAPAPPDDLLAMVRKTGNMAGTNMLESENNVRNAQPLCVRHAELGLAAPPVQKDPPAATDRSSPKEHPAMPMVTKTGNTARNDMQESDASRGLEQLKF